MFSNATADDMVGCPYNKLHRMARKRLQPHLIKCRLSYPDVELCKCPFNASHLVPEPEFTHHVSNCPDKGLITQYKYNLMPLKIDEEDRKKQIEVDCDENWDETEVNDYNPTKHASQANVIRAHIGDLPSTRKEFRKSERKRLGDDHSSDEEEDKKFGKKNYHDFDCKKEEEMREQVWYEDRGGASTSRNNKESYKELLNKCSRDKGLNIPDAQRKRPIKWEKADNDKQFSKKQRQENYHLDEDPYYNSNNATPYLNGSAGRGNSLGHSRGTVRRRY